VKIPYRQVSVLRATKFSKYQVMMIFIFCVCIFLAGLVIGMGAGYELRRYHMRPPLVLPGIDINKYLAEHNLTPPRRDARGRFVKRENLLSDQSTAVPPDSLEIPGASVFPPL
jgi:hypothetical protein